MSTRYEINVLLGESVDCPKCGGTICHGYACGLAYESEHGPGGIGLVNCMSCVMADLRAQFKAHEAKFTTGEPT